jgi:hypothetical protein
MSVADQISQLAKRQKQGQGTKSEQMSRQLKSLEKAKAALEGIGVSLEPVFNISLKARITGGANQRRGRLPRRGRVSSDERA